MNLQKFLSKKPKKNTKKIIFQKDDKNLTIKIYNDNSVNFFFKNKKGLNKVSEFLFATFSNSITTDSENQSQIFFKKAKDRGTEGLMFKSLDAGYVCGLRTGNLVKLKGLRDELDLVIVAAKYGQGKLKGLYSSFLVAVKNDISNETEYSIVGLVGSGFKEKNTSLNLDYISKLLKPLKIDEKDDLIFFKPKIIVQVKYQEIQKSSKYNSGYALRFPIFSTLREDKPLDEINTLTDIKKIYTKEFN